MSSCPACDAAGVPTCSDGLNQPVHIGAIIAGMGLEPVDDEAVSEPIRGKIGAEVKTAPGGALTPESQGLADCEGVD